MKLTLEKAKEIMKQNNGNLVINDPNITELPEGLAVVDGDLQLRHSGIEKISVDLNVKGKVDFSWTKVIKIEGNLHSDKEINFDFSLPTILKSVDAPRITLERLSIASGDTLEKLKCDTLIISGCTIEKMPQELTAHNNISIFETNIMDAPALFTVDGNFNVNDCAVQKVPEKLVVKGKCSYVAAKSAFPKELEVESIRLLHTTAMTKPEKFIVSQNAYLTGAAIDLPDDASIGGNLDLQFAKVKKLPKNLYVGENLDIRDTALSFSSIPKSAVVEGTVVTDYGHIENYNETLKKKSHKKETELEL